MNLRTPLILLAVLSAACSRITTDRENENQSVHSAKIDSTLKVSVQGASIQRIDKKSNPLTVHLRAQSFDLRIETADTGCAPRAINFAISNIPAETRATATHRLFLDNQTPEALAAHQVLAGGLTIQGDAYAKDWTPLSAEIPFETTYVNSDLAFTVTSDRGSLTAETTQLLEEAPADPQGACARLMSTGQGSIDEAALVVRQRHQLPISEGDFAFATFGNTKSNKAALRQIIDSINNEGDIAFTVISGDLYSSSGGWPLTKLTEELDRLPTPWFATLGDSDLNARNSDALIKTFGASTFAFDYGTLRVIVLDSADATLDENTHDSLEKWLKREALWWDEPDIRSIAVITHTAPFDPSGTRGHGFKHRMEGARLLAILERADVDLLLTSHLATYKTERQGDVLVVYGGGGGASLESSAPKGLFWLRVDVSSACSPVGTSGTARGEECGDYTECSAGLTCLEGVCTDCLRVTKRPI